MSDLLPFFNEIAAHAPNTYFVGGCLRQFFLNQAIHDYDFVCESSAIQLAKYLAQRFQLPYFVLDAERDIARLVISAQDTLDFATLQGKNIEEDLALRDLTINAMAYSVVALLPQGTFSAVHLIDPMGGYKDLQKGVIRGITELNFQADPLRLVRIFRFAAQHDFSVNETTLSWVQRNASRLQHSASERVLSEFEKILKSSRTDYVEMMWKTGLLQQVLSVEHNDLQQGLQDLVSLNRVFEQLSESMFSVCLTGSRSVRVLLRLYVLGFFHYFRKSSSHQNEMSTGKLLVSTQKLKSPLINAMSSSEWSFFQKVSTGLLILSSSQMKEAVDMSRFFRKVSPAFESVYILAKVLYRDQKNIQEQLGQMYTLWQDNANPIAHPKVFLSGHEVASVCNEKPGPKIGQWLDLLLDAQAMGDVTDRESAVTYLETLSTNYFE